MHKPKNGRRGITEMRAAIFAALVAIILSGQVKASDESIEYCGTVLEVMTLFYQDSKLAGSDSKLYADTVSLRLQQADWQNPAYANEVMNFIVLTIIVRDVERSGFPLNKAQRAFYAGCLSADGEGVGT